MILDISMPFWHAPPHPAAIFFMLCTERGRHSIDGRTRKENTKYHLPTTSKISGGEKTADGENAESDNGNGEKAAAAK